MKNLTSYFIRILLLLAIVLLQVNSFAAYLKFEPVTMKQPDGTVLNLFVTGDEFYNRLHDEGNFTIIRNPSTGWLEYAVLSGDQLVSTGLVPGKDDPAMHGLNPGIDLPPGKILSIRMEQVRQKPVSKIYLNKDHPKRGSDTLHNLVVFIRFNNENEFTDHVSDYNDMFNNSTPGYNSMYNYYREASYNQVFITSYLYPVATGITVTSYQDSHPRLYYMPYDASTNTIGYSTAAGSTERRDREFDLLENALNSIKSQVPGSLSLDYNNDGYVDNVCFIVSGTTTAWSTLLWPHQWSLFTKSVFINGKQVMDFNLQVHDHLQGSGVGVLCHEMFHTLGAPDLYHYSSDGFTPVGTWDLMESNTNPPQHMGAFMKYRYGGWINYIPEITTSGKYTLDPLTSPTNNCFKIKSSSTTTNEYFIVEYRLKNGIFENSIPGSGLLIYRINAAYDGLGNRSGPPDEVYIYRPNGAPDQNGDIKLAHFSSNVGRTSFTKTTNPYCFFSDGSIGNLNISKITSSGNTISFYITIDSMEYVNVETSQNTSDVGISSTDQQVIGLKIVTKGIQEPLEITRLNFNTSGSTNTSDLANAKLFYTGKEAIFNTSQQVGSTIMNPSGSFSFNDNVTLYPGSNYFWLTYDISPVAVIDHVVDAQCIDFIINGTTYTPMTGSPAGNRKISKKYAEIPYFQDFEMVWTDGNSKHDIPDIHWLNTPPDGDNSWRRQDDGVSANWSTTLGKVSPASGAGAANFHSWDAPEGSQGMLDLYLDFSQPGPKILKFNYQNTDGKDSLFVFFQKNNDTFMTELFKLGTADWTNYMTLVDTGIYDSCMIRFMAVSDYGATDIGLDDIVVSNRPIIDFTASSTSIYQFDNISFNDLSLPDINGWNWTFKGAVPDTSSQKNPAGITYMNPGRYDVTLKATNAYGNTTLKKTGFIEVKSLVDAGPDRDIICSGTIQLQANLQPYNWKGPVKYTWTPSYGLSDTSISNPYASPMVTTTYVVRVYDTVISVYDTVMISVAPIKVDAGIESSIGCNDTTTLVASTNYRQGQFLRMNLSNPAYMNIGTADFGSSLINTYVNGNIRYTQDITSNYNGCNNFAAGVFNSYIALIDRGVCNFSQKAYNAQLSGAIGVIIANNTSGVIQMAAGVNADLVTIPVIMVSKSDGDSLKAWLSTYGNVNVSMGYDGPHLNFSWTPVNGLSDPNAPVTFAFPKTTTAYTLSVTDYTCVANDQTVIRVTEPYVFLGDDTIICEGSAAVLDAGNAGASFLWSDGKTTQTISVDTAGTYAVMVTNTDGCYNSDTIHVDISFIPAKPSIPSGDTILCYNPDDTYYSVPALTYAQDYQWELFPSTAGSINGNSNAISIDWNNSFSGFAALIVSGHNDCGQGEFSDTQFIQVKSMIPKPTINWDYDSYSLSSSSSSGNQWYSQNGKITGATQQTYQPTASGTYYVIVTYDGCQSEPSDPQIINTGIKEQKQAVYLDVSPNPNSGDFRIRFSLDKPAIAVIQMKDALGKTVIEKKVQAGPVVTEYHFDNIILAEGVYFINLVSDEGQVSRKIVVGK